jgi:CheY-like chemotaxis protein
MTAPKRLLIVDDEPDFAAFVAEVGRDLGYHVTTTSSAAAFRDAYRAAEPDMIVLDILMPDADGIEVVRWLVEQGCRAPVAVISGYNPVYAEAARTLGETVGGLRISQLSKPVKLADLRACLQAGLR